MWHFFLVSFYSLKEKGGNFVMNEERKVAGIYIRVSDVVDNSTSKFPKGYFDGVSVEGFTKSITNEKTKNYIKFTQFDLVYSHNIENKTNSDVEYNEFFNRFNNFIVPSIIEEYNIRDFSRMGIVYNFEFTDKEIYDKC